MNKPVYKKCKNCKCTYTLGVDGIKDYCDTCAEIERDEEGYIKWEYEATDGNTR